MILWISIFGLVERGKKYFRLGSQSFKFDLTAFNDFKG